MQIHDQQHFLYLSQAENSFVTYGKVESTRTSVMS